MYLLKTDLAPGEPMVGPFLSPELYWSKFKYGPLGDNRDLDLVVSSQEIWHVSIYKST